MISRRSPGAARPGGNLAKTSPAARGCPHSLWTSLRTVSGTRPQSVAAQRLQEGWRKFDQLFSLDFQGFARMLAIGAGTRQARGLSTFVVDKPADSGPRIGFHALRRKARARLAKKSPGRCGAEKHARPDTTRAMRLRTPRRRWRRCPDLAPPRSLRKARCRRGAVVHIACGQACGQLPWNRVSRLAGQGLQDSGQNIARRARAVPRLISGRP